MPRPNKDAQYAAQLGFNWNPERERGEIPMTADQARAAGYSYDSTRGVAFLSRYRIIKEREGLTPSQLADESEIRGTKRKNPRVKKSGPGFATWRRKTAKTLPEAYRFIQTLPPGMRVHVTVHGLVDSSRYEVDEDGYGYVAVSAVDSDSFQSDRSSMQRADYWASKVAAPLYRKTSGDYDKIVVRWKPATVVRGPAQREL
jgi:hypothetical protein